jgi:hypothetical protein
MGIANVNSVAGYWLGPQCWLGPVQSESVDIPGFTQVVLAGAFSRPLSAGSSAVVTRNGVVLIDFTGLDTLDPKPHEIMQAPFGDDKRQGLASLLTQHRVEMLNAHQLCLLTAIGTHESEDDFWAPQPRPVEVETLFHGSAQGNVAFPINIEVTKALLAFAPSTLQKALFNVPVTTLDRSFDMFEELVNGPPLAARTAHRVLLAADHYRRWRFDQAVIAAWSAAEALLAGLWERYIADRAAAEAPNGYVLTNDRRKRLADLRASTIAEILALAGVIDQLVFDDLTRARSARNKWVHGLTPVGPDAAESAIRSAQRLLELTLGVHLAAPLILRSSPL